MTGVKIISAIESFCLCTSFSVCYDAVQVQELKMFSLLIRFYRCPLVWHAPEPGQITWLKLALPHLGLQSSWTKCDVKPALYLFWSTLSLLVSTFSIFYYCWILAVCGCLVNLCFLNLRMNFSSHGVNGVLQKRF